MRLPRLTRGLNNHLRCESPLPLIDSGIDSVVRCALLLMCCMHFLTMYLDCISLYPEGVGDKARSAPLLGMNNLSVRAPGHVSSISFRAFRRISGFVASSPVTTTTNRKAHNAQRLPALSSLLSSVMLASQSMLDHKHPCPVKPPRVKKWPFRPDLKVINDRH